MGMRECSKIDQNPTRGRPSGSRDFDRGGNIFSGEPAPGEGTGPAIRELSPVRGIRPAQVRLETDAPGEVTVGRRSTRRPHFEPVGSEAARLLMREANLGP